VNSVRSHSWAELFAHLQLSNDCFSYFVTADGDTVIRVNSLLGFVSIGWAVGTARIKRNSNQTLWTLNLIWIVMYLITGFSWISSHFSLSGFGSGFYPDSQETGYFYLLIILLITHKSFGVNFVTNNGNFLNYVNTLVVDLSLMMTSENNLFTLTVQCCEE